MKYILIFLIVATTAYGQGRTIINLPRHLFEAAPYRVDFWSEPVLRYQTVQANFQLAKPGGVTHSDTVLFINLTTTYRDTIYFCRVPTVPDSSREPLCTAQGGAIPFIATTKAVAPSLDAAMKLEMALGQLADSLTLLETKRSNYIKTGNKSISLIGVGILLAGLCVGDLIDEYPNNDLEKISLRAGITAGSLLTAYGLFEGYRYLTKRSGFKSMETRMSSYTEDDIRRLMMSNTP